MTETTIIIMACLIGILYFPWILVAFTLPWQILRSIGSKCKSSTAAYVLQVPQKALNWLTGGGIERYCIYKMSTFPAVYFRRWYYRRIGASIAKNVIIHYGAEIRYPLGLSIGKGSIIGDRALLDARQELEIGCNVNMSSNVSIYTRQHNHRSPSFDCEFPDRKSKVKISDRAWLGCNVVVLPGVTIGEGAVVCAGAVVTKDVEPYAVVAGIPAKQVSTRPRNLTYEFGGKTCWFL